MGLDHLDPGELRIQRWGEVTRESTFTRRVRPGQTLFGKRRAYQRKTAYAEFDAVCSGDILVFETADSSRLLPALLPFVAMTDAFYSKALETSAGSLSPRTRWTDIAQYEFELPPLDQQARIADLLWAIEGDMRSCHRMRDAERTVKDAWLFDVFGGDALDASGTKLDAYVAEGRPICYGVLKPGPEFDGGPLIVDVKDYPRGVVQVDGVRRCDPRIEAAFPRSRLRPDDVLLSIRGTIGRVCLVPEDLDGANISRDTARISINRDIARPRFVKALLESQVVQRQMLRRTTGLAVKGLNVAVIRDLDVPSLSLEQQDSVLADLDRLDGLLDVLERQGEALADLRRAVLSEVFGRRS